MVTNLHPKNTMVMSDISYFDFLKGIGVRLTINNETKTVNIIKRSDVTIGLLSPRNLHMHIVRPKQSSYQVLLGLGDFEPFCVILGVSDVTKNGQYFENVNF